MKLWVLAASLTAAASSVFLAGHAEEAPQQEPAAAVLPPSSAGEARSRAVLLHQVIDGALQVVHRDFFDEDNAGTIPSASLEDVFEVISADHGVKMKWLVVDTDVVNVDHRPADDFERAAAAALAAGKRYAEEADEGQYRYAGSIRLASQCLKCHVQNRTSTEARTAGLLIAMPMAGSASADKSAAAE